MTEVKSVIRQKDDHRILIQLILFQTLHDFPDVSVHRRHTGIIPLDILAPFLLIVRLGALLGLPRMFRKIRYIREVAVIVFFPDVFRLVLPLPRVMRSRVVNA